MSNDESVSAAYDRWQTQRVPRKIIGEIENRSTGLPQSIRHDLETRLECGLSDLKIVVSPATEVLKQTQFHTMVDTTMDVAYGKNTIYFTPGKYNPYSSDGLRVLEQGIKHVMTSASVRAPFRSGL
jgi:hypothetical protein